MQENQFHLFNTKRFLPLFITQFLGAFNDNVFKNALVVLITYEVGIRAGWDPDMLVLIAAGIFILPFFLFSAMAGQYADKLEKSAMISKIKLVEIILMVLASAGLFMSNLYLLMMVLFLMGTQSTFFGPIKYGILPDHLEEDELIGGNGLIEMGTFLAILVGTILGGLLVRTEFGIEVVSIMLLLMSAAGYLVSKKIPLAPSASPELLINYNFFSETINIIGKAKAKRRVFLAILGISWFWLYGATYLAQFPTFSSEILSSNEQVVTLLLCTFSIGIGFGSMICNKLVRGMVTARFVPLASLMMTVFSVDLYFASSNVVTPTLAVVGDLYGARDFLAAPANWRVLADLFGIAVSGGIYIVPLYAIMQTESDEKERSRIIAANNILNSLFMVASAVGCMLLLQAGLNLPEVFLTIAILNGFVALYICQLLPQDLAQSVIRAILRVLYRVEVIGLENYRQAGRKTVIIANHTSFLDGLLLGAFLPDTLTFAINTHISEKWWVRPAYAFFDLLAIDPTNPMATKAMVKRVQKGRRCVIFPEGRITMTGALMKVYEGPGTIAFLADAPLLPIRIDGADRTVFSRLKGVVRQRWFPKITLSIQEPVTFDVPEGMSARDRRGWIGRELYDVMSDVIFKTSNMDRPLFHALIDAKKMHGAKNIVLEDVERAPLNYKKLILGSFVMGRKIATLTKPGERVGILLPNSVGGVVVFFATLAYGRVPAMLNFSTGPGNMIAATNAAQIKTILTSQRFVELGGLEETIAALQDHADIVYLEDVRKEIGLWDKVYGLLLSKLPNLAHNRVADGPKADDDGVVLFTSGSEGTPKGVVLSHKNIQSNRYQLSARVDFTPSDRVFNALPIFHSFGLTGGLLLPILSGLKIFLYPSPLHYRIVPELVYDTNSTIMFGTDTFLSGYARFAHAYDFYSLRYVFAGAEKLKPETKSLWAEQFGVRILEGYGATETSPVLSTNTAMQAKSGTVGRLMPGIEYKLEDVPGIDVGGKLVIRGPNVMKGYLRAENPGVLEPPEDGWYDTGDIVEIDEEGYIKIAGRAKRFAKIAGEMVSLTAVEAVLGNLWPEETHAVVSLPDPKKGEQLILITTCNEATNDMVRDGVKAAGHSELLAPKTIMIVDEVPVLGTGKTDYVTAEKVAAEKIQE
mgnify:FL=1